MRSSLGARQGRKPWLSRAGAVLLRLRGREGRAARWWLAGRCCLAVAGRRPTPGGSPIATLRRSPDGRTKILVLKYSQTSCPNRPDRPDRQSGLSDPHDRPGPSKPIGLTNAKIFPAPPTTFRHFVLDAPNSQTYSQSCQRRTPRTRGGHAKASLAQVFAAPVISSAPLRLRGEKPDLPIRSAPHPGDTWRCEVGTPDGDCRRLRDKAPAGVTRQGLEVSKVPNPAPGLTAGAGLRQ